MSYTNMAGRHTFRPTLESLETRALMDAGLGSSLPTSLLQSDEVSQAAAQVRQMPPRFTNSANATSPTAPRDFAPNPFKYPLSHYFPPPLDLALKQQVTADLDKVASKMQQFLQDKIIDHGFNRWLLQAAQLNSKSVTVDDTVVLHFKVAHGIAAELRADVIFVLRAKKTAGVIQYELRSANLNNWQGWVKSDGQFDSVVKDLFNSQGGNLVV